MAKPNFGCGKRSCSISTGICGSLTFGKGELSDNGYWEFPCRPCEEAWHRREKEEESLLNKYN